MTKTPFKMFHVCNKMFDMSNILGFNCWRMAKTWWF